jgi:hypothetical protein
MRGLLRQRDWGSVGSLKNALAGRGALKVPNVICSASGYIRTACGQDGLAADEILLTSFCRFAGIGSRERFVGGIRFLRVAVAGNVGSRHGIARLPTRFIGVGVLDTARAPAGPQQTQ